MREFLNILKDIKSGALPVSELPNFMAWLLGRSPCIWLAIIVIAIVITIWLGR